MFAPSTGGSLVAKATEMLKLGGALRSSSARTLSEHPSA